MSADYKDLIGIPYKPHGRDKDGMDCYGLVIEVLSRNGLKLRDLPECDIMTGANAVEVQQLDPLSIVHMKIGRYEHMAVYIGDGMIIHSMMDKGVLCEPIWRYQRFIKGYYKVTD